MYGLPAILCFIGANISQVVLILYYGLIFPVSQDTGNVTDIKTTQMRLFNVLRNWSCHGKRGFYNIFSTL